MEVASALLLISAMEVCSWKHAIIKIQIRALFLSCQIPDKQRINMKQPLPSTRFQEKGIIC